MLELFRHKIVIISGHFGTGKTNIAVNLAMASVKSGRPTYIADLDIVNPYFRTADNAAALTAMGVKALIPPYANTNVDIPSLPPSLPLVFSEDCNAVFDIGGNEEGSVVLRVYRDDIIASGYDMYYVYNAFRPENVTPEAAVQSFLSIKNSSGLEFTGIINNTNLGTETTPETVRDSFKQAEEFARLAGVPVSLTTAFAANAPDGVTVIEDITKKLY